MPALTLNRGLLIAVEGIDGCGKSTLAKSLASFFTQQQLPTLLTKEPGGTPLGQVVRHAIHEKKGAVCPRAEFLLFAADRAQHMEHVIEPHLRKGYVVISDRMGDSSLVYQGYGRGLEHSMIMTINQWAMKSLKPDITIHVKVDVAVAMQRIIARHEKMTAIEQEAHEFFEKLSNGFDQLYARRTDVIAIDGNQTVENCYVQATEKLSTWINNNRNL
jgi:dTMP kinase